MKIYELSKETGVDNKAIIDYLQKKGANIKNHMSTIPDSMVDDAREHFSKNKNAGDQPAAGIGAIALPEAIRRQIEAQMKARAEAEKARQEQEAQEKGETEKEAAGEPEDKKEEPEKEEPVKEAPEPEPEKEKETQAPAVKAVKPEAQPEVQTAPQENAEGKTAEKSREPEEKAAGTEPEKAVRAEAKEEKQPEKAAGPKKQEQKGTAQKQKQPQPQKQQKQPSKGAQKTQQPVKPASDPKKNESEAIKSLREKIVKGKIDPSLLGINTRSSRNQNSKNEKNEGGSRNNNQRQRNSNYKNQNNRNSSEGAGRGQSTNTGSRQNRTDRNDAPASAPVIENQRGKGKGGKQNRDRFDKNKGDKFDRLENERGAQRSAKAEAKKAREEEIKVITLPESISLKDFADKIKMQPAALIKKLFLEGKMFTVNDILDFETAEEIALGMDIIAEKEIVVDRIEELLKEEEDPEETLKKRPPVVCIMGHVDHGKTSLLDAIRSTNVTQGEAGGITQHIGAYTVDVNGESITFLDTPGHEAFTAMRMRGAQSTDVAILVVAADDGVMPQTVEAINHAKAAGIHVIVAVNKIDKPGANVDKVKQELTEYGLIPGDWGGSTIFVPVSAKTGEGIEELLEMVILDTEILELRANPDRMARGVVIEAKLDKGRGAVATLLVQKGTLKIGDHVAMGESYGKVRVMTNDKGKRIKTALPSTPVEITGLNGVPSAGDVFVAFETDKEAKNFSQVYVEENKKKLLAGQKGRMSLEDVFDQMKAGELKELNIIIKADVQGSVEAIKESLEKLSNDEIVVKVIHSGAGNVSESDVILASASNAIIIAFNVDANPAARDIIEHEKVDMRKYSVIYNAIDDVELAMKGMLEPVYEEVVTGHVEVRQIFKASGVGIIAGAYVTDGMIKRNSKVRLSRGEEQLFDGPVASLKRFADDAKEVRSGFECGIVLKDFQDIKEGDIMEAYEMKEVPRNLG